MDVKDFKIQWFPGHMTKARRMMEDQLRLVDVVVELLDARIPDSSINPMLRQMAGNKPRVIALNKMDMADPVKTEAWLQKLKQEGVPVCSNVGKSTLINRLAGQVKAIASDRPGVTKQKQWVNIAKGLQLLDTPGVLWPKFEDPETGLHLALTGAVKDDIYDRRDALVLLLQEMLEKYPQQLAMFYHITLDPEDTAETVMEKIGAARGCVKAGGVLDMNKVEQMVLYEFKTAKMGRFTLDEPV